MTTPEGKIQLKILNELKKRGYYVWRNANVQRYDTKTGKYLNNPQHKSGIGDIIGLTKEGKHLEVEVKTSTGKVSIEQEMHGRRVRSLGGVYIVARSLDDIAQLT